MPESTAIRAQFAALHNRPGVYLITDLGERPLYAGKSNKLRSRLLEHFLSQSSSATADALLDPYEVLRIFVWYCDATDLDAFETAACLSFQPRWNRAAPVWTGNLPELHAANADAVIGLRDSLEQLAIRREPLERAENKLLHLLRAVRKARVSGASPQTRQALQKHASELVEILSQSP